MTIEPIKTGEFRIPVRWIFADAFMMDPESYQNESQFTKINQGAKKTLVKERQL